MMTSKKTYEKERRTERSKQCGGIAFLTSPIVNGGLMWGVLDTFFRAMSLQRLIEEVTTHSIHLTEVQYIYM